MKNDVGLELTSPLLTEKQTAQYLKRSLSSLRRDRLRGAGPEFLRFGRSIRYRLSALDAYIDSCRCGGELGVPNA